MKKNGFSLIEMMVSIGIGSMAIFFISSSMSTSYSQSSALQKSTLQRTILQNAVADVKTIAQSLVPLTMGIATPAVLVKCYSTSGADLVNTFGATSYMPDANIVYPSLPPLPAVEPSRSSVCTSNTAFESRISFDKDKGYRFVDIQVIDFTKKPPLATEFIEVGRSTYW